MVLDHVDPDQTAPELQHAKAVSDLIFPLLLTNPKNSFPRIRKLRLAFRGAADLASIVSLLPRSNNLRVLSIGASDHSDALVAEVEKAVLSGRLRELDIDGFAEDPLQTNAVAALCQLPPERSIQTPGLRFHGVHMYKQPVRDAVTSIVNVLCDSRATHRLRALRVRFVPAAIFHIDQEKDWLLPLLLLPSLEHLCYQCGADSQLLDPTSDLADAFRQYLLHRAQSGAPPLQSLQLAFPSEVWLRTPEGWTLAPAARMGMERVRQAIAQVSPATAVSP